MNNVIARIESELQSMLSNHPERPKYCMQLQFVDVKENVLKESSFEIFANNPVKKIYEKVVKLRDKGGYRKLSVVSIHKEENDDKVLVSLRY